MIYEYEVIEARTGLLKIMNKKAADGWRVVNVTIRDQPPFLIIFERVKKATSQPECDICKSLMGIMQIDGFSESAARRLLSDAGVESALIEAGMAHV